MEKYAEKERLLSQPRKTLISSFTLQNATLITPLLLFYLQLGLVCPKNYCFVEYTPNKGFNSFVQPAVDARWHGDENRNSSVVAEAKNILANSSYGYQTMDRSRHTVTKYLSDEETHEAINSELFKKLDHVNNALYEIELAKAQIEHKNPIIIGFFMLQYAKLRLLELYYNFFTKLCDVNKFEELEMDTDSLHFAPAEKEPEDCVWPEMTAEWEQLQSADCIDSFIADSVEVSSDCAVTTTRNMTSESMVFPKRTPGLRNCCLCSKTYCCYDKSL